MEQHVEEQRPSTPARTTAIGSAAIGEMVGEYSYCRTGDHFSGGMFVAFGPGIRPGTLGRTVSIMDFAPTFCRMLGLELPDVDGRPIGELLAEESPMCARTALSDPGEARWNGF